MASDSSFDIVSRVDLAEVANAVNIINKEVQTRYDFRGSSARVDFDKDKATLALHADSEMRLNSLAEVVKEKLIRRKVSLKALTWGKVVEGSKGSQRQDVALQMGIPMEKAKEIVKLVKDLKIKVQAQIQDQQVRVSSKSKDELQKVITTLRAQDLGLELQFVNYR
ncbi:MAG: YajQ family cyclic di-GMP-binding protein [Candidatus Wallbacteria bacterium]|nr:YajQ family cyclic di-GMP-binding protein [Candidatus Wallbacteria bacterium]MBI4865926.1 YajQ family cyclic di-GMP-binding protein [Candidatus Wallbacteria bacterium]